MWLLLVMSLVMLGEEEKYNDQTSILVLSTGKKMMLVEPYRIEGNFVIVKTKLNQVLQLPIKKVNLKASERATRQYHEKRKEILFAKPKEERKKNPLPDQMFSEERHPGLKDKKVHDFSTLKDKGFDDEKDFFQLEDAWALFHKGEEIRKNPRLNVDEKKSLRKTLENYSKLIWECKASDKRKATLDELTWETHRRQLKNNLEKAKKELSKVLEDFSR